MNTKSAARRVVVVTGAASGIGRATALAFATAGCDLAICDVDADGLAAVEREIVAAGSSVIAERVDVADREAMRAFADTVHARWPAVDVLVNNAGVAVSGGFLDTTLEDWDWIVSVNLWGVVHGLHAFLPPMVARGAGGHVVNVASAAGLAATSTLAAYATTKFAVVGLSEALRDEVRGHRIGVTTVCPGFINTPIVDHARTRGKMAEPGMIERTRSFMQRGASADRVASAIVRASNGSGGVLPVTPHAWALFYMKRASPALTAWLGSRLEAYVLRSG